MWMFIIAWMLTHVGGGDVFGPRVWFVCNDLIAMGTVLLVMPRMGPITKGADRASDCFARSAGACFITLGWALASCVCASMIVHAVRMYAMMYCMHRHVCHSHCVNGHDASTGRFVPFAEPLAVAVAFFPAKLRMMRGGLLGGISGNKCLALWMILRSAVLLCWQHWCFTS